MTDFQAALGISQLERLDGFITKRNKIAHLYDQKIDQVNMQCQLNNYYSARHLYVIRLNHKRSNEEIRNKFIKKMKDLGINLNLNYIPIHLHPFYRRFGFKEGDFPEAELYYKEAVSLPIYQDLSKKDVGLVIDAIKNALIFSSNV